MTLSNLGPVAVEEPFQEKIEDFHVMIGVSPRQPLKCGVMAFGDTVDLTFASVKADRRFEDYVYGWLEQEGILTGREENGAFASEFDRGSYPEMTEEKNRIRKAAPWFYGALLAAAVITGIVNAATYRWLGKWWSGALNCRHRLRGHDGTLLHSTAFQPGRTAGPPVSGGLRAPGSD